MAFRKRFPFSALSEVEVPYVTLEPIDAELNSAQDGMCSSFFLN
jgi:hypothetical protein